MKRALFAAVAALSAAAWTASPAYAQRFHDHGNQSENDAPPRDGARGERAESRDNGGEDRQRDRGGVREILRERIEGVRGGQNGQNDNHGGNNAGHDWGHNGNNGGNNSGHDWSHNGNNGGNNAGQDWGHNGNNGGNNNGHDWGHNGNNGGNNAGHDWGHNGGNGGNNAGHDWGHNGNNGGNNNGHDWGHNGNNHGGNNNGHDWGHNGGHDWANNSWRDHDWRDDHRRDDHRYDRWRHTHRDFDRPRYRDWREVRYGGYFDYGYSRIVAAFFGRGYYWWSYDGWHRPYRRWAVGYPLPSYLDWEPVPYDLYYELPPAPYGCRYVMVDGDILLIALETGVILDALLYD